jgi:ferredoxin, 2Fe-2S
MPSEDGSMTKISFIDRKNRIRSIDADNNSSAMRAAVSHGVKGIAAECGGNGICATCHVYVDEAWIGKLGPVGEDEDTLLDSTVAARLPNSRLSCQIRITPALDGLTMRLPERQS